jgi:hypothetical protein
VLVLVSRTGREVEMMCTDMGSENLVGIVEEWVAWFGACSDL